MTALALALLVGAGFLAAAVQAVTGAGFGLVAAPLVMLLAPGLVPGPLLVVTVALMGLAVFTGHRTDGRLGRADARLLVTAVVGILVGTLAMLPALGWVEEHGTLVKTVLGVGVLVTVIPMLVPGFPVSAAGPVGMGGAGVLAGVLTVLAALPGPPLILTYPAGGRRPLPHRTGVALSGRFGGCLGGARSWPRCGSGRLGGRGVVLPRSACRFRRRNGCLSAVAVGGGDLRQSVDGAGRGGNAAGARDRVSVA